MLTSVHGNLVMVGLNTTTPKVFFNGTQIAGLTAVKVDWEEDEQRVKLKVQSMDDTLYAALVAAGVIVKRGQS